MRRTGFTVKVGTFESVTRRNYFILFSWYGFDGGGVDQLVVRRTQDQKTRCSNPIRSTRKMIMHHVLIMLTLTFIQDHTGLILSVRLFQKLFNHCTAHQVCCEDSPTKGLYNLFLVQ